MRRPGKCLRVTAAQAERLEQAIDRLNENLQPLNSFILPGGTPVAAWLHLARTVCRRAERAVVTLKRTEMVNPQVLDLPEPAERLAVRTGPCRERWREGGCAVGAGT